MSKRKASQDAILRMGWLNSYKMCGNVRADSLKAGGNVLY